MFRDPLKVGKNEILGVEIEIWNRAGEKKCSLVHQQLTTSLKIFLHLLP